MDNIKTTVYLRASDYGKLKRLAVAEGRSAAQLIREAVTEYAARRATTLSPRSIGMGDSGIPDWTERYEELMEGFGEDGPIRTRGLPAGTGGHGDASTLKCDEEIPGIPGKP